MTNQEAIDQALYSLGILQEGQSANATMSATCLDLLNQMMTAWAVEDKDLQFPPQDTLGDTFPVPVWAESAVIDNLAISAASTLNGYISQALAIRASNGESLVVKTLINAGLQPADMSHMPVGNGS